MYNFAKLEPTDIGIITPYRMQAQHIRMVMHKYDLDSPKVGTVEEFQGQERKIILISTVRSSLRRQHGNDINQQLDFIFNLKRMNVAISRPR